ncbi:uracil-DNA glycosylase [Candidatus Venteria ishoeyi]|uniref:uracil-DNA glycosylase n=1 Tax=Candidatus Venteria ishoeyi TaxID=1899563 RepID=UPI0025A4F057|nr:uracil-DNA glycosylase [Candidatus Venteria ishoeyi]MDM8545369.1 uracil-DNA glycosylase [Candidatus Venteria ishoeyi]
MSLSRRLYLEQMGITLWQRRDITSSQGADLVPDTPTVAKTTVATTTQPDAMTIKTETLNELAPIQFAQEPVIQKPVVQEPDPLIQPPATVENTEAMMLEPPPAWLDIPPEVDFDDGFEPVFPEGLAEPEVPDMPPAQAIIDPWVKRAQDISQLDWDALQQQVSACQDCPLAQTRQHTVFGMGNKQANWLLIGEASGSDEDRLGEPFVGRAGKLLNAMLTAVGANREQVYIANTVKCHPPHNRDPNAPEIKRCAPFLERQIQLLQPRLILALGKVAAQRLLQTEAAMASFRQQQYTYGENKIPLLVTYHPAYLLRRPKEKAKAWEDLLRAITLVPVTGQDSP